jgi:hypothetical protein
MTTLLCSAFRAVPLHDGRIQLEIETAQSASATDIDPSSTRVLYAEDIALKLRIDAKTVLRRSLRRRNPLPLKRVPGSRPFMLESALFHYVNHPAPAACNSRYL